MILYLDTSALVKLYALEPDSDLVKQAVARADQVATSVLAYVEARSAFARKRRMNEIDDTALKRTKRAFDRDWGRINRLPVDPATVRHAAELAEHHRLRDLDALHLATADLIRTAIRAPITFACFDVALNGAALDLGLSLLADE